MPFKALNNREKEKAERSYIYSHTTKHLTLLTKSKRSQSALEYMMTYGWAILIIVIVAVILYSMGIFNPSSSISATVTGFSSTPVSSATCYSNGVLHFSVGDITSHRILIKSISGTINGKTVTFTPSSTVDPNPVIIVGDTYSFSIPDICPSAGSHFSATININYTEPTTAFSSAVYTSSGAITGTVSSTAEPAFAAYFDGNAYPIFFRNGVGYFYTNGANTYINATNPLPGTNKSYTLVLWALDTGIFNENYNSSIASASEEGSNGNDSNGLFAFSPGSLSYQQFGVAPITTFGRGGPGLHRCKPSDTFVNVPTDFFNGQWHFVAVSVNKPNYIFELDGNQYTASNSNGFSSGNLIAIGDYGFNSCDEGPFNGYIADVQLYNGSLSASQLLSLYKEGVSGSPLSLSSAPLIGYWPLNGTVNGLAKDYAGADNGNFINSYITSNFP